MIEAIIAIVAIVMAAANYTDIRIERSKLDILWSIFMCVLMILIAATMLVEM